MPRRPEGEGWRPGRPPLDRTAPSVGVHLKLPGRQYDRLYREAREERTSVPELIRRKLLTAALVDDERE